ncbi:TPA: hypothetical protein I1685_000150 [Staphylococcus pseudintermedius]|nr:hypothetical protein [Staphylococcus pseudintermedius]
MKRWQTLGGTLIGVSLVLGACGGASQQSSDQGDTKSSNVEGTVKGNGSSTVAPIIEKLNEDFSSSHDKATVENVTSGTGDGFKQFIAGKTDFSNASRPIKDEEKEQLEDKGIDYTEFKVARDGLTIAVNKDNDFLKEISLEDLKKIYSGEAKKWSDVDSDYPDKPIKAFSPDQSHGTYDFFTEEVMDDVDIQAEKNQNTDVILMDEPTSALDPISTLKVEELIQDLKKDYSIIIVTHNMQQAARVSDKTAFFLNGYVNEYDDTDKIFSNPSDKQTEDYISGRFG